MTGSRAPVELRSEEWLRHQYLDLERSANQIAIGLCASRNTVSYYLRKHNIPIRSRSQSQHHAVNRSPRYYPCMNRRQEVALVELTQSFIDAGQHWAWEFDPDLRLVHVTADGERMTIHRNGVIDIRPLANEKSA